MSYKNPIPVVVALARCGEGLIVIERNFGPFKGQFALPGGYVDEGEDAESAVSREFYEETGIFLDANQWSPVMTSITADSRLLIFMLLDDEVDIRDLERFKPNEESASIRVALESEELCFPLHTKALRARALWS